MCLKWFYEFLSLELKFGGGINEKFNKKREKREEKENQL